MWLHLSFMTWTKLFFNLQCFNVVCNNIFFFRFSFCDERPTFKPAFQMYPYKSFSTKKIIASRPLDPHMDAIPIYYVTYKWNMWLWHPASERRCIVFCIFLVLFRLSWRVAVRFRIFWLELKLLILYRGWISLLYSWWLDFKRNPWQNFLSKN